MMKTEYNRKVFNIMKKLNREHPYLISFIISLLFFAYVLFYTPYFNFSEASTSSDTIQLIDINSIKPASKRRIVKKRILAEQGAISAEDNADRASGSSEDANAVDISFYPGITPPRPIGRLHKRYPKLARDMNIEATIIVELIVMSDGIVKFVNIVGIHLSKNLPSEIKSKVSALFARDTFHILKGTRFTPPMVNGKNVSIKMEMPLQFKLN